MKNYFVEKKLYYNESGERHFRRFIMNRMSKIIPHLSMKRQCEVAYQIKQGLKARVRNE
jgi:hypothetical protein